jgi:hypothetical protein
MIVATQFIRTSGTPNADAAPDFVRLGKVTKMTDNPIPSRAVTAASL